MSLLYDSGSDNSSRYTSGSSDTEASESRNAIADITYGLNGSWPVGELAIDSHYNLLNELKKEPVYEG